MIRQKIGWGDLFLCIQFVLTVILYFQSKSDASFIFQNPYRVGIQLTALLGTVCLAVTFILSTKISLLELLFGGLDRVYRIHRMYATAAFILLTYHPILLIIQALPDRNNALKYIIPGLNVPNTWGILAYLVMMILLCVTIFFDLPYHIWKKTHEWMGVVLIFGAIHGLLVSSDISRYLPLRIFIFSQLIIAGVSFIFVRFVSPRFIGHAMYELGSVKRIGDTLLLRLLPRLKPLRIQPGQFAFFRFIKKGISSEEHPFSIASSEVDGSMEIAIKICGDYTLTLTQLTEGTPVAVNGPYGCFGERFVDSTDDAVLIAGGIGITPIRSLVLYEYNRPFHPRNVTLIHTVKNQDDGVYSESLTALSSQVPWFHFTLHKSRDFGRLTAQSIQSVIGQFKPKTRFFLCGPASMMNDLAEQFRTLGIRRKNIVYEDFSFI